MQANRRIDDRFIDKADELAVTIVVVGFITMTNELVNWRRSP